MKLKLENYWIKVKHTAIIFNLLDPRSKSDLLKKIQKRTLDLQVKFLNILKSQRLKIARS